MNIFVLDDDPAVAARYHCDKHVVKMTLETAQILSTVRHLHGASAPYRSTHAKHPCTVWAAKCSGNYDWLVELGLGLCEEYSYRRGRTHGSEAVIRACVEPPASMPREARSPFAQAMPEGLRRESAVEAYRAYYLEHKRPIATWSWGRPSPPWWST